MVGVVDAGMAVPGPSGEWEILPVGAGGFLTNLLVTSTNLLIATTDTYGAYWFNTGATTPKPNNSSGVPTGAWQQLVTSNSMPTDEAVNPGVMATGVGAVVAAPSSPNIWYMLASVYQYNESNYSVYVSANAGRTWTLTNFTPVALSSNHWSGGTSSGFGYRAMYPKLAVHPTNPDIVIVGTDQNGVFISADGMNFSAVSSIPTAAAGTAGNTGVLFAPNNGNIAFCYSDGNGIYATSNAASGASSTWYHINNGAGPQSVACASISAAGVYWVVDFNNNLWSGVYNATAHTCSWVEQISDGTVNSVAADDPFNANHVLALQSSGGDGKLNESNNGISGPWSGWTNVSYTHNDIPWLADLDPYGMGSNNLVFDQNTQGIVYSTFANVCTANIGTSPLSTSTTVNWNGFGQGIEQLVGNVVVVPPGCGILVGVWDDTLLALNGSTYPSAKAPVAATGTLCGCWNIDYAKSNPTFAVAVCDDFLNGNATPATQRFCFGNYSGGAWSWTLFGNSGTTKPTGLYSAPSTGYPRGCVAVSTPSNFMWAGLAGGTPQYTLDGGATWTALSLPTSPALFSWNAGGGGINPIWMAADWVNGDFYFWNNAEAFYTGTVSGSSISWTRYANSNEAYGENPMIAAVPGNAGHLFWSTGWTGNNNQQPTGGWFGYCTNGQPSSANFTQVTNVFQANCFGFGAAAPGQSYPAVYMAGWLTFAGTTPSTTISSALIGTNLSFNVGAGLSATFQAGAPILASTGGDGALASFVAGTIVSYSGSTLVVAISNINGSSTQTSWNVLAGGIWQCKTGPSATMNWIQIGPWPNGSLDEIGSITGDMNNYGAVYISNGGSGFEQIKGLQ
jgi:hypothetical protein